MLRIALFSLALLSSVSLFAQEQLGVRLDAYSGMQTTFLNPAHSANFPLKWNLNLAGLGFFADNSYLFLRNTNVPNLLANPDKLKLVTDYKGTQPAADDIIIDFVGSKRNAFAIMQAKINGPAFIIRHKQHSGGLFYNMHYFSEAARISHELNYYEIEQLPYRKTITLRPVEARMMAWAELGANYSFNWETNVGRAQLGINAKYLSGFEGAYAGSWSPIDFTRYPKDTVQFGKPDATVALTTGNLNNLKNGTYDLQRQGQGLGFDLGFSWLIADYDDTYKWRFSASLLDIGKIKFAPQAEEHYFNKINPKGFIIGSDFKGIENPTDAIRKLSTLTVGDSLKSLRNKSFAISTPMTICLMADYQFFARAYATILLQQRILQQDSPLHRGNLLAASVRYEHRWFSASIPFSLYNYKHFRTGFAARLGYLTLGTDNLGSWVRKKNFTGTDMYFSLIFNPFAINIPGLKIQARHKRDIKCYKF